MGLKFLSVYHLLPRMTFKWRYCQIIWARNRETERGREVRVRERKRGGGVNERGSYNLGLREA